MLAGRSGNQLVNSLLPQAVEVHTGTSVVFLEMGLIICLRIQLVRYQEMMGLRQADHRETASGRTSREARAYRAREKELSEQGRFREAQSMDINDVQRKFGDKYDEAMYQMRLYTDGLDQ